MYVSVNVNVCLVDMHDHLCTSVLLCPYSSTKKSLVSFALALLCTRLMLYTESFSFSFTVCTFTSLFSYLNSQFCLYLFLFLLYKPPIPLPLLNAFSAPPPPPPFSSPILPNSFLLSSPSSPEVTYIIILSFCHVLTVRQFYFIGFVCMYLHSIHLS